MNRTDARKVAQTITREQLEAMFERAKTGVKDWSAVSGVNPYITKGKAWNILYRAFMSGGRLVQLSIANMVHEFGDFVDEDLKPKREHRKRPDVEPLHEEPVFEVVP